MPSTMRIAFFVALQMIGLAAGIQAEDRQWYRLGPYSSMVVRIAVDPTTPQIVYAIGDRLDHQHKLYKSTNGGNSWTQTNAHVYDDAPLVINPASPQTIYAGIDKSTDGGVSWSRFAGTDWSPTALAIDSQNPQTIYAGTNSGILRSTNGGNDWSKVPSIWEKVYSLAIDPLSPQTVYAGTLHALYKSTDGGANWSQANTGLPTTSIYALAIDPKNPQTIFAGTDGRAPSPFPTKPGIFKSTNGGINWNAIDSGFVGSSVGCIVFDSMTPQTIYAAAIGIQDGLFRSSDGGNSWTKVIEGDGYTVVLAISPSMPQIIYASASQFGMQKSMNWGKSWIRLTRDCRL